MKMGSTLGRWRQQRRRRGAISRRESESPMDSPVSGPIDPPDALLKLFGVVCVTWGPDDFGGNEVVSRGKLTETQRLRVHYALNLEHIHFVEWNQ
jgi:hypothetical protein